jgi:hypothetical protein
MRTTERENIRFFLDHLPETKKHGLYELDSAVHSFVRLMGEKESIEEILNVVDQMFVHYTKMINHCQEQNKILLERAATHETLRRIQELNDAKSAEIK